MASLILPFPVPVFPAPIYRRAGISGNPGVPVFSRFGNFGKEANRPRRTNGAPMAHLAHQ